MRIHIGKYVNFIGPYQIAEKILFWLNRYEDDRVNELGRWLAGGDGEDSLLMKFCLWVESKRKRKVKIHIDNYDVWSMDSTLALIILPMLKQLKETKHGAPCSMRGFDQASNSSAQNCFDFYEKGDDIAFEYGQTEWSNIMDELIWTFEQLQPDYDWENQYTITKAELDLTDYPEDEGKDMIPVRWKTEGEYDWEGMKKHNNRIQEGLELFGKYFTSLWD